MTPCYLLPMLPNPITFIESVYLLKIYSIRLHRLHRLQNRRNGYRKCLKTPLFMPDICLNMPQLAADNVQGGLRYAV